MLKTFLIDPKKALKRKKAASERLAAQMQTTKMIICNKRLNIYLTSVGNFTVI